MQGSVPAADGRLALRGQGRYPRHAFHGDPQIRAAAEQVSMLQRAGPEFPVRGASLPAAEQLEQPLRHRMLDLVKSPESPGIADLFRCGDVSIAGLNCELECKGGEKQNPPRNGQSFAGLDDLNNLHRTTSWDNEARQRVDIITSLYWYLNTMIAVHDPAIRLHLAGGFFRWP